MSFGQGIAEAAADGLMMIMVIIFGTGVFVGWLIFWMLPTVWPIMKVWINGWTA